MKVIIKVSDFIEICINFHCERLDKGEDVVGALDKLLSTGKLKKEAFKKCNFLVELKDNASQTSQNIVEAIFYTIKWNKNHS